MEERLIPRWQQFLRIVVIFLIIVGAVVGIGWGVDWLDGPAATPNNHYVVYQFTNHGTDYFVVDGKDGLAYKGNCVSGLGIDGTQGQLCGSWFIKKGDQP